MALHVVVLAAGQGKRMHSTLPKVLHRLAGRPLLAHVLETAKALSAERAIVVHGHGSEAVKAAFNGAAVEWVEQAEQLGTGHALMQALPKVPPKADVMVLYGDVPLVRPETLERLKDAARDGLGILTVELDDPTGYGRIVRDAKGRVKRIVEQKDASAKERAIREVNVGFMVAKADRLTAWLARVRNENAQKEYYLTDVIGLAATDGVEVGAVKAQDWWEVSGVNSKRELAALERAFQHRQAGRLLDSGVSLADPARLEVRGELRCGRDVSIDVNCVFEGRVTLGDGVSIGPNCVLRNVTVAAGSEVHAFSLLEDAEVGARCRIGPYARLRPGTRLDEEVHVGNFVEVKASHIGKGSKANHLSYIGDAELGRGVNVGAGTITCNYDGERKHATEIGEHVFIGSDTMLVAPLKLGDRSRTGAGAVVTKNVPPDTLVVGMPARAIRKLGKRDTDSD